MLKLIAEKLKTVYAIHATYIYSKICGFDVKVHVDYHVGGVAKISAIDKLEVNREDDEIFYMDDLTTEVTKRFDSGYYRNHKLIVTTEGEVVEGSFRTFLVESWQDESDGRYIGKEEWLSRQAYRPDQARIVYPDGTVNTDADFVQRVLSRKTTIDPKDRDYLISYSLAAV